jgi:excisionase family DNA binding protein
MALDGLSQPIPLHPNLPSLYFQLTNGGFIMGKNLIDQDRWLSVEEIAFHLGIKKDTAYKWVAKKHMPAHKVGRLLKFDKAEIDAWVKSGAAETGSK